MKKVVIWMVVAFISSGCMDGGECEVTATESGGSRIECPGEPAVITDEAVPEDTQCQMREEEVACTSGHRFEVPEENPGTGARQTLRRIRRTRSTRL